MSSSPHQYVPLYGDVGTWCGHSDGGPTCGLSKENPLHEPPEPNTTNKVLACVACNQEMTCDAESVLPLHMDQGRLCVGSWGVGAPSKSGTRIVEPLTIDAVGQLSVSEILAADTCWSCGGPKTPGQTICKTCHGLLPFVHQKALPDFIRGYLFSDEEKKIQGHFTKSEFMEVFQSALKKLATMRSERLNGVANG